MSEHYQNYIDGIWRDASDGRTFEDRNPARWSDLIGTFPLSNERDVDDAVKAARKAFHNWRLMPAPKRGLILQKAGDLLVKYKEDIAREMTREMGKSLIETRADVQEAIDTAYYAASETRRLFQHTVPSELPDKFNMTVRMPVGVCGIITAWNFPVAVPSWKIFPALASGNTVVFKPSEDAPKSAMLFVQTLIEAGVPAGVINLIHGDGSTGRALVEHPDVNLIAFTGSSQVGAEIASICGKTYKKVSLEMGGKNPQIVMDDARLDLALEGVLWGAFGTTGQRCTATSRLILHEAIHDEMVERLIEEARKLRIGYALEPDVDIGPLINEAALKKVTYYVELGQKEGARLVLGGKRPQGPEYDDGFFFEPTIFVDVKPHMRIAQEEIFGPVLSVLKVSSFEEAIAVANDVKYGLSSSIYTQDVNRAFVAMRELEAGITYINAPTIGAEAHMPFGGIKQTGNGHREGGWTAFDIFTEIKTVYVDYSGRLQKAQIDTYES